jgi:hypothetical protein
MNEQNDHDLLIKIETKLDRAIVDIKDLKDNTTARVTALEEEKASQKDLATTQDDLKKLSRLVYIGLGIVLTLEFALTLYVAFFKP